MNGAKTRSNIVSGTSDDLVRPAEDPFPEEVTRPYNEPPERYGELGQPRANSGVSARPTEEHARPQSSLRLMTGKTLGGTMLSRPRAARVERTEPSKSSVPLWVLRDLLKAYTERLGAAARPVLVAEMRALGVTPESIRENQMPLLVGQLAARLDTVRAQSEFLRAARIIHPSLATY